MHFWLIFLCIFGMSGHALIEQTIIQAGKAAFQTENIGTGIGITGAASDETYYPRVAAPNHVSATSFFAQDSTPQGSSIPVYRLHSWLGGAILWATNQYQSSGNGYFVPQGGPINNPTATTQAFPLPVFHQGPLIADPILLQYVNPPVPTCPNLPNNPCSSPAPIFNPNNAGILLSSPYPYLVQDASYGSSCQAADSTWNTAPLELRNDPIPMLLLYPSMNAPVDGQGGSDTMLNPPSLLVDRMGDYSVDLIYQNPNNPYTRNKTGQYIKMTVTQGSPYIFCESLGIPFIVISNRITTNAGAPTGGNPLIQPATNSASVPGVTNVFYSLLGGNQIDPAQFSENTTLNPVDLNQNTGDGQANFTTWAVYYTSAGSFTGGMVTATPQNSYLTVSDTTTPFYFVIAALPTIYKYPYDGSTYAAATSGSSSNVNNYAQELGKYAFNFITDTQVSYSVTKQTFLNTTYRPTFKQPYGSSVVVDPSKTVMCLMPHHYQNQLFDQTTGLTPTVLPLDPGHWNNFSPPNASSLFYWTIRGNLKTIVGDSFSTRYVFSNFLPTMPPPYWTDTVQLGPNGTFGSTTIGQLLFDSLDNEYINNLANNSFAPWNTAYYQYDKGIYDVGKTLAKGAKQLGLLLHFIQGLEDHGNHPSDPFYNFFTPTLTNPNANPMQQLGGCGPAWFSGVPARYGAYTSLYEQQYNNSFSRNPGRPGAFNPCSGINPVPKLSKALQNALQTSIAGSINPSLSGVQGAITGYFLPPVFGNSYSGFACTGGNQLTHFAYYDPLAHLVMMYPSSGTPSTNVPWPVRQSTIPNHAGNAALWESFGVADLFNDHHYQYGWWISASALAALYDGVVVNASNGQSQAGYANPSWAAAQNYGTAIDQLVKDVAYDPAVGSFYNNNQMFFAKMNFFDQWAGHGWADGLQASVAGGNAGHNENSCGEAMQAYASIILWGMATGRQDIVNLGIYLYTTASYAIDSYFLDKNLNYMPGGPSFVPTVTTNTPPAGYSFGDSYWTHTIHNTSPATSGTPKIAQGVLYYSSDFGQTPQNVKLINAFPINSFSLVFGRNQAYLRAWNDSMNTSAFQNTVSSVSNDCWNANFVSNLNMLRALGGNSTSIGIPGQSSSLSPYQAIQQCLTTGSTLLNPNSLLNPPWGAGNVYEDPGQSINEVLHFMHIIDHYGTPNWNYYGVGTDEKNPNQEELVFTATFTNNTPTTTFFAFNPSPTKTITVQFYNVSDGSQVNNASFTVKPKRWGQYTSTQ